MLRSVADKEIVVVVIAAAAAAADMQVCLYFCHAGTQDAFSKILSGIVRPSFGQHES